MTITNPPHVAELARYICRNFICATSCKECGYGSTALEHAKAIEVIMKLEISKDWCTKMAELEGDQEIGAGSLETATRKPVLGEVMAFLNKIEGDGYGGMAAFETARTDVVVAESKIERLTSMHSDMCAVAGRLGDENDNLREFIGWVDCWISNPVGSYSVAALDGLFKMTRDKIAALAHR